MKLPKKLDHHYHLQHVFCASRDEAEREARSSDVIDFRPLAMAHGWLYYFGALLVWLTPLRFIAQHAHRVTLRGEHVFNDRAFRNPFAWHVVTRSLGRTNVSGGFASPQPTLTADGALALPTQPTDAKIVRFADLRESARNACDALRPRSRYGRV